MVKTNEGYQKTCQKEHVVKKGLRARHSIRTCDYSQESTNHSISWCSSCPKKVWGNLLP